MLGISEDREIEWRPMTMTSNLVPSARLWAGEKDGTSRLCAAGEQEELGRGRLHHASWVLEVPVDDHTCAFLGRHITTHESAIGLAGAFVLEAELKPPGRGGGEGDKKASGSGAIQAVYRKDPVHLQLLSQNLND